VRLPAQALASDVACCTAGVFKQLVVH
jgi:hypothetical protein